MPASILLSHQGRLGDTHIVKENLVELVGANDVHQGTHGDAGGLHIHNEHADPFMFWDIEIGLDSQPAVVSTMGKGSEYLLTVDNQIVAILHGSGLKCSKIGSGRRFAIAQTENKLRRSYSP